MSCCEKTSCQKILAIIFIVIALALAILVTVWRQGSFVAVVSVSRFFDVMLPVLAVGALIKYILTPTTCICTCHSPSTEKETKK